MLEIGIGDSSSPDPRADEPSLSLDDDGYFCFLCPWFEQLAETTGQIIDLYESACFEGANLALLGEMLEKAAAQIVDQPPSWPVFGGIQFHGEERREIFHEVNKEQFQELIRQWQALLVRAEELNLGIVCSGD